MNNTIKIEFTEEELHAILVHESMIKEYMPNALCERAELLEREHGDNAGIYEIEFSSALRKVQAAADQLM